MSSVIYRVSDLVYAYGNGPRVLDVQGLEIERETITGLIGPNGSGKTTFLRLLAFVQKPVQGEIRFKDRPTAPFAEHARFCVTFLPQTPYLLKRSVYKNIAYGLKVRGVTDDLDRRVEGALALVGLSAELFRSRHPEALSGGQAQRVALAARLALEPEVLLLDEPTANVDAESAHLIKEAVLAARQERGATVLVASHDLQWMYEVADRLLQMYKGVIWEAGNTNVVPGPWRPGSDGRWEKHLSDGGRIRVPRPPFPDASAVIDFSLSRPENGEAGANILPGTVSRLILEQKRQAVAVTLAAGHLTLTVRASCREVERRGLLPGRQVLLCYDPDAVVFI